MNYVGVDPGLNGAIAVIRGREVLLLEANPLADDDKETDVRAIGRIVREVAALGEACGMVEKIEPFGKRSRRLKGFHKLAESAGFWQGALAAAGCETTFVRPLDWKRNTVGLKKTKAASVALARQLFPSVAERLVFITKHDGLAEALLIAYYAQKTNSLEALIQQGRSVLNRHLRNKETRRA